MVSYPGSSFLFTFELNLLGSLLAPGTGTLRTTLRDLSTNANVTQYMYWRNIPGSEEIKWYGSFYKPSPDIAPLPAFNATTAPYDWRQLNWREDLARTNNTLNVGAVNAHYIVLTP